MKINEDWDLTRDGYNIILVRYGVAEDGQKKGERVEREKFYYPTMEKALLRLVEKSIDTESSATILATIRQSTQDIIEMCKLASKDGV